MGIFRLKFFKEEQKKDEKVVKSISQPQVNSKRSLKRKAKSIKNKERQQKHRQIIQTKKKQLRKQNVKKIDQS